MITLTIGTLVNSTEILQKLANMSLKAKLAWQVAKMLKEAEKEIQSFNETRMNLVKKYGTKDDNGELITDENGNCKIPEDQTAAFTAELNELVNTETEINANKINIEQLGDIDFTPAEMTRLEPFIEFDE